VNATERPSAEMAGSKLLPSDSAPELDTLTRLVVEVTRSRTNTSSCPFASPGTRSPASETKTT
jgi:hypothetical protein